jgi:hypothetical protein
VAVSYFWWRKPEKTTDILYHILLYRVHLACTRFDLTTSVVKGTDCIGRCISNYHTITTTAPPTPPPYILIKCLLRPRITDILSLFYCSCCCWIYPRRTWDKVNNRNSFLLLTDCHWLQLDTIGSISTRFYVKRDDFNFTIINFPLLDSNIQTEIHLRFCNIWDVKLYITFVLFYHKHSWCKSFKW